MRKLAFNKAQSSSQQTCFQNVFYTFTVLSKYVYRLTKGITVLHVYSFQNVHSEEENDVLTIRMSFNCDKVITLHVSKTVNLFDEHFEFTFSAWNWVQ